MLVVAGSGGRPRMADTDREERAARNESLFREVNDRISDLNEAFAEITHVFEIACECSSIKCIETIMIGREEYRAVRQHPSRFVVLPGHVAAGVEQVVSEPDGFVVVEKVGAAGEFAAELADED
jgi:hypothetical protein